MDIEKDLNQTVVDYFDRAIRSAAPQLLLADPDKVRIAAPKFCIDRMTNHYLGNIAGSKTTLNKFHGYELIPGYELAIVIYHESAPLHDSKSVIFKLPLK